MRYCAAAPLNSKKEGLAKGKVGTIIRKIKLLYNHTWEAETSQSTGYNIHFMYNMYNIHIIYIFLLEPHNYSAVVGTLILFI